MRRSIHFAISSTLTALLASAVPAQTSLPSVEDDVLSQIRSHPVDGHTLGDMHVDDEFLRRVADRLIRETYQEKYHVVVRDEDFALPAVSQPTQGTIKDSTAAGSENSEPPSKDEAPRGRAMTVILTSALAIGIVLVAARKSGKKGSQRERRG